MTNKKLLNVAIDKAGFKKSHVAEHLGLSNQGFRNKVDNKTEFTVGEMSTICELLHISKKERDLIFFAKSVDETST